jgi:acetyl-CoA acetyltransferase
MNAYIVDGIRTPIGSLGGSLSPVRADDVAAMVIKELMKRNETVYNISWEDEDAFAYCSQ